MSLFEFVSKPLKLPDTTTALPDRSCPIRVDPNHYILGNTIVEPVPDHIDKAVFGLGCFWGAERLFWSLPGIYSTAVGYAGGITANPSYEDVCSGQTGHTEVVLVFFDPTQISFKQLLKVFWESHNPTEGMKQGNDVGTQYRSAIYGYSEDQLSEAKSSLGLFQGALSEYKYPAITTEIKDLKTFYYAETYHQQYLGKNPNGYCGIEGTGAQFKIR